VEKIERENAITEIIDNVRSDGYDDAKLQAIGMPPVKEWTEINNQNLRNSIKKDIFNKLRQDTNPHISPAQFIKMGFLKQYLADEGITENADGLPDKINTYTLNDLKTYGRLSITELKDAGFTEAEYEIKTGWIYS
jgi:hypothetical protein